MNKLRNLAILVLALMLALTCAALGEGETPYDYLGQPMPDFETRTIDGGTFSLSEALREKDVALINLWASWCGPCESEFPCLEEAYEMYYDRVAVIALSVEPTDDDDVLLEYAAAHDLTFPIANDSWTGMDLGDTYATMGIPTSLIVDRFGNIAWLEVGAMGSASDFIRAFEAFLGDDYTETTVLEELPPMRYSGEMPDADALCAALNAEGGALAFDNGDDWPMLPVEKDGRSAVTSTNAGIPETAASVVTRFTSSDDQALAFDFATSTEAGIDLLNIDVDGERVKSFGGEHGWTTWALPMTAGAHEVTFTYVKDEFEDGGEDAVWLDEVRLISDDEAQAIYDAMPVYPVAEETTLAVISDGAREIVIEGVDEETLSMYFASQSYWIVNGDEASLSASLRADVDPESAFFYLNYDGSLFCMAESLNADGTAYEAVTGIDRMEVTGYPYSNVYVYPRPDEDDPDAIRGIMLFADEENVNAFAQLMEGEGMPMTWRYADGELPATDTAADAAAGESVYNVTFVDQDGAPVPGCVINFCTDDFCQPETSDAEGKVQFIGAPYAYHLQVIKVPEGYAFDTTQEFYANEAGESLTIAVTRQ